MKKCDICCEDKYILFLLNETILLCRYVNGADTIAFNRTRPI